MLVESGQVRLSSGSEQSVEASERTGQQVIWGEFWIFSKYSGLYSHKPFQIFLGSFGLLLLDVVGEDTLQKLQTNEGCLENGR